MDASAFEGRARSVLDDFEPHPEHPAVEQTHRDVVPSHPQNGVPNETLPASASGQSESFVHTSVVH